MTGIYKITNLINGKFYIGKATRIEKRRGQHFGEKARGHSKEFASEIKKYGRENFYFEVIETCSLEELCEKEAYYIRTLKPQYNVVRRGEKRDDEFCRKVSEGAKKWWANLSEETKQKIIDNNLTGPPVGHAVSEETREKIRKKLTGTKHSQETIEKRKRAIAELRKNKPQTNAGHRKKAGADIDGVTKEFESVKECAEFFGVKACTVSRALKRKGKVKGNKVWYVV